MMPNEAPETLGHISTSADCGPLFQGSSFNHNAHKPASFQQHIETQAGFVTIVSLRYSLRSRTAGRRTVLWF